jgi:flagellar protein FliS
MYTPNPLQAYRQNQVETAAPAQLVVLMYDGALKAVKKATVAMEKKDHVTANRELLRAQDIVLTLREGLDHAAGEVADNLDRLYDYLYSRLIQANLRKDPSALGEVTDVLAQLRPAWLQCARQAAGTTSGLVAAGAWR